MRHLLREKLAWLLVGALAFCAAPVQARARAAGELWARADEKKSGKKKAKKKKKSKKKNGDLKPLPPGLEDGYKNKLQVRVRPRNFDKVRLIPDGYSVGGPVVGRPTEVPSGLPVVQPGDMPRVLIEDGPVRALLYVPSDNLQSVIVKLTVGWPEAKPAPRAYSGPGLYLQPGAPVRIVSKQDDLVRIRLKDEQVDLFSWIPKARVGKMYVPGPAQSFRGNAWVKPGTALTPDEGGGMLGRFRGDAESALDAQPVAVRKLGAPKGDKHLVEFGTRTYIVRGWVDKSAFVPKPKPTPGTARATGTGHGETNPNRVRLSKGSRLYDSEGGDVIGLVKQDNTFFADQRVLPGGWIRIRHYSAWGELSMWAHVAEAAFAKGTFGEMILNKSLFWLADEAGTSRCQAWQLRLDQRGGFEGGMDWSASRNGNRVSAGYRFQYAMGMVVLEGPGENSRALRRRGAPSDFYSLSILSCGARCLQVGGLRWYFDRKACEAARASGVKGTALKPSPGVGDLDPDQVADELEKSTKTDDWGDEVSPEELIE